MALAGGRRRPRSARARRWTRRRARAVGRPEDPAWSPAPREWAAPPGRARSATPPDAAPKAEREAAANDRRHVEPRLVDSAVIPARIRSVSDAEAIIGRAGKPRAGFDTPASAHLVRRIVHRHVERLALSLHVAHEDRNEAVVLRELAADAVQELPRKIDVVERDPRDAELQAQRL